MAGYSKRKEYLRIKEKLDKAEPLTKEELERFRHIIIYKPKKKHLKEVS